MQSICSQNETFTKKISELNNSLTADTLKFQFATDGEGNYGYLGADDSFIPFKSNGQFTVKAQDSANCGWNINQSASVTATYTTKKDCSTVMVIAYANSTVNYPNTVFSTSCKMNNVAMLNNYGTAWYDNACKICVVNDVPAGTVFYANASATQTKSYGGVGACIFTDE